MVTLNSEMSDNQDDSGKLDKKRNIIIYSSEKAPGITIFDVIDKMGEIAQQTKKTVETEFNGIVFQVTPKMTPLDRISSYLNAYKDSFQKSPEYQQAFEKYQEELKEKTAVDQLIQHEKLDITNFTKLYQFISTPDVLHPISKQFLDRWGRLMQVEKKLQGLSELTLDFINKTATRATYGMNITQSHVNEAYAWLTVVWAFGNQLAKVTQQDTSYNTIWRALTNDKSQKIYENYQQSQTTDPIDMAQNTAQLLTRVLPNASLIDKFVARLKTDEKNWDKLVPALKLPTDHKTKHQVLNMTVFYAKQILEKNSQNGKFGSELENN